jgi:hypothetical protein
MRLRFTDWSLKEEECAVIPVPGAWAVVADRQEVCVCQERDAAEKIAAALNCRKGDHDTRS